MPTNKTLARGALRAIYGDPSEGAWRTEEVEPYRGPLSVGDDVLANDRHRKRSELDDGEWTLQLSLWQPGTGRLPSR